VKPEIFTTEKPGIAERLSSRLSIHGASGEGLGGIPELTDVDFAGVIGMLESNLQQIILGAKIGNWSADRYKLREIITRRSWDLWFKNHNESNINVVLNVRIADLVLSEYFLGMAQRKKLGDTRKAKKIRVGTRRYQTEIKSHQETLVAWLDAEERDGVNRVRRFLKNQAG
jgi:hypothetical protein